MDLNYTASQIVFNVYITFAIAFVGLTVPLVSLLLSVFSQGRQEVARIHQEKVAKIVEDIKANELSKKRWAISFFIELTKNRYKLLLLKPNYYILLLTAPPVISVIFSILALKNNTYIYFILSALFALLFFYLLWSFIKLISEVTSLLDEKKEERERSTLETLQNILKAIDPNTQKVKACSITINSEKVGDHDFLPSVTLGKESLWDVSFKNSETGIAAHKVEVGIQFPTEAFTIRKQTGYRVYDVENIVRFSEEYVQNHTNRIFVPPLAFTPTRTGEYKITAWVKGENIETKFLNLKIKVEQEI